MRKDRESIQRLTEWSAAERPIFPDGYRGESCANMKAINRLVILILALALSAGCSGRETAQAPDEAQPTESSQETGGVPSSSISDEAASAFAGLGSVTLRKGDSWRVFRIDPAASRAAYVVDEELFSGATRKYGLEVGKTKVIGETQDLEGLLQIDPSRPALGANRFAVYLPTLRTDQALRDGWIRENALESDRYPLAVFVADQFSGVTAGYVEGEEARFELEGDLSIRGTTVPTVWRVEATLNGDRIRGSMQTTLRMTSLGIDPPDFAGTLTVLDEFLIQIDFEAFEE